jgi:hypothetical protein
VGLFANCSKAAGCVADCSPPANDPIATGNPSYDLYDGCILAAMQVAGLTEPWMGKLLKAQAMNESGITPSVEPSTMGGCGGQNCGIWAISAGAVSGDPPPGPCGSSSNDPPTGTVDYSHSYGLFQSTPACEGTFLTPQLPPGVTCTGTTTVDDIPFTLGKDRFYCESATSLGVTDLQGNPVKGYINAWQTTTSPLYATSIFNPAYQIYVYISYTWYYNFGCSGILVGGSAVPQPPERRLSRRSHPGIDRWASRERAPRQARAAWARDSLAGCATRNCTGTFSASRPLGLSLGWS